MKQSRGKYIAAASVIAALYAALTLALSPISYNVMQIRLSEGLTVLALYTPAAVPGLFVGCFFANILGPGGVTDAIFGSLATLLGALGVRALRRRPWIALAAAVVSNAVIVGLELRYVLSVEMAPLLCMGWVALGEAVSIYLPAIPMKKLLDKNANNLFKL